MVYSAYPKLFVKQVKKVVLGPFYRRRISQPPTKFLILTKGRTGSHLLLFLLESHPQIRFLGMGGEAIGEFQLNQAKVKAQLIREGTIPYLERRLKRVTNEVAVGFKVLYHQFEERYSQHWEIRDLAQALDFIRQDHSFKIIHLKRRNKLKRFVSHQLTFKTDRFIVLHPKMRTNDVQIELTVEQCEKEFHEVTRLEERYDELFSTHETLEVYYEELATNTDAESRRVLDFLGVEQRALQAITLKQNVRPLSDVIKNYNELKVHFANTEWAYLFNDGE